MMAEWQPIGIAPKDGSAILGFWPPARGEKVRPECYAVTRYELGEWLSIDDGDDTYTEPAFWMPLPDPPSEM